MGNYERDLFETVPYIGASPVQAKGLDGKGIKVAVLDSGIDPLRPETPLVEVTRLPSGHRRPGAPSREGGRAQHGAAGGGRAGHEVSTGQAGSATNRPYRWEIA